MSATRGGSASVAIEDGLTLSQLARAVSGRLTGRDAGFRAVSTDTRSIGPGDLFIALRGPNFDAHEFAAEAQARGAVAALVERPVAVDLPTVVVDDTRLALGRFAAWWRTRFGVPVAGVTGSNGKTTVKEMLAHILSAWGQGVVTRGNLNNDIGVPLTLLNLARAHRFAVVEMGASRPGDIEYLSGIAHPDVVVVTNAAPAHLAGFGDIAGVARAKGEIFAGLREDGVAVVNNDDPRVGLWRVIAGPHRIIGFGIRHPAEVSAQSLRPNDASGCSFELSLPDGKAEVELKIPGRHNVMNALAAAAVAHGMGASLEEIVRGLGAMAGVERRLQVKPGIGGARVIDDTYNANPGSVKAALEVLATSGAGGEKLLILGDMGELGNASQALHEQIGRQARVVGVNRIYALGELACIAAGTFGKGSRHFATHGALIEALREDLQARTGCGRVTALVKGSRSMKMELIVDAITSSGRDSNTMPSCTGSGNGAGTPGKLHARNMRYEG